MNIKERISFYVLVILFSSCGTGNKDAKDINTSPDKNVIVAKELDGCYRMNIAKDTAMLQLNVDGLAVTGTLLYNRFEKDDNNGVIAGKVQDNIIKLMYSFRSEGMNSVREVYFKVVGDKLIEGYGDMEMHHDSAFFSYPTALRYEENHPYIKVDCSK